MTSGWRARLSQNLKDTGGGLKGPSVARIPIGKVVQRVESLFASLCVAKQRNKPVALRRNDEGTQSFFLDRMERHDERDVTQQMPAPDNTSSIRHVLSDAVPHPSI